MKAAEVATMVKDEVEPLGGFIGDAFVQPALLGGQALTALVFIMVQNFWLGMIAAVIVGVQVVLIPRMRRRLIVLGRERQLTARELSGRVGEIVDGIGADPHPRHVELRARRHRRPARRRSSRSATTSTSGSSWSSSSTISSPR